MEVVGEKLAWELSAFRDEYHLADIGSMQRSAEMTEFFGLQSWVARKGEESPII